MVEFLYDGDGTRVVSTINGVTTRFVGEYYEVTDSSVTKYYGGTAMRNDGTLSYLLSDHLGSNSLILDTAGNVVGETRYTAWGEERYSSGSVSTDYTYTGQYSNTDDFGLMYYKARWYDPVLGRFAQADSIVPNAGNPISWDRYAYVNNNPIRNNDPTGHFTNQAIRKYLKDTYGNDWKRIWGLWYDNAELMDMLHKAKAGDVLSYVYSNSSGEAQIGNYLISGVGNEELYGLYDSQINDLNAIFSNSAGFGIIHPDDQLGYTVVGHMGNIGYDIHKVNTTDIYIKNFESEALSFVIGTTLTGGNPYFGAALAGANALVNSYNDTNPGTAFMGSAFGDVTVSIYMFSVTNVNGVTIVGNTTQWTYISRGDYVTQQKSTIEYVDPHRNF